VIQYPPAEKTFKSGPVRPGRRIRYEKLQAVFQGTKKRGKKPFVISGFFYSGKNADTGFTLPRGE
jgi:hypothetical protein